MVNVDPSGQSFWSVLGDIFGAIFGSGGGGEHGGGINPTQVIIGAIGTGINIRTHAGGSGGSAGGSPSAPPSSPPVSSFPGESLGIPSGMNLPGPFGLGSYDPLVIDGILPAPASVGIQANSNLARGLGYFAAGLRIWLGGRQAGAPSGVNNNSGGSTIFFGTHYCGPGGGGNPVNPLDQACRPHDNCYDDNKLFVSSNFDFGLTPSKKAALQRCNQKLCESSSSVLTNSSGGSYVRFYFGHVTPVGGCQ